MLRKAAREQVEPLMGDFDRLSRPSRGDQRSDGQGGLAVVADAPHEEPQSRPSHCRLRRRNSSCDVPVRLNDPRGLRGPWPAADSTPAPISGLGRRLERSTWDRSNYDVWQHEPEAVA